ncbi:hypothetical protein KC887_06190 [Candidatus Kaiserbacteria bacterium]|nr:hypothetical protein [Candidatus Kaiserbacteria bacterium]
MDPRELQEAFRSGAGRKIREFLEQRLANTQNALSSADTVKSVRQLQGRALELKEIINIASK